MTWIKWAAAAVGLLLAAFFGIKAKHHRELEAERRRLERAKRAAAASKNSAAVAQASEKLARIDLELARLRQRSVLDRVRAAVAEARRRRQQDDE